MMKYDLDILNKYIEDGLLECQSHPTLPLKIYNYSRDCQFEKKWDDITLAMRGTILDSDGNLVAKSFNKFFNIDEIASIPNDTFDVFEKMDGSLGLLFNYNNQWIFASKGSFTSEQAIKGCEIFKKLYPNVRLFDDITYIFEIIYPENRIVCHYPNEDVILIGAWYRKINRELDIYTNLFDGLNRVKKYDGLTDIKKLKSLIGDNREGFVIKFHMSGLRVKIKGDEYVRLHRLLTNFSNVDIWECLKNKTNFSDFLERVPDEFDLWVRGVMNELLSDYRSFEENCVRSFNEFKNSKPDDQFNIIGKKEYAMWVMGQPKKFQGVLFSLYDGKDYSDIIWRLLRPKYQKPFWSKEIVE